jgi:hypothetical protein
MPFAWTSKLIKACVTRESEETLMSGKAVLLTAISKARISMAYPRAKRLIARYSEKEQKKIEVHAVP